MSLPKWLYNEYVHEIGHGLSNRTRCITVQIAKALLILTVFSSCATRPPDPMATSSDTVKATNRHESNVTTADTALENDADYLDCIRGPAEPIVKQSVYPNAIFSLNPDNHHGTETVDLSNGDRLVIRNHGCEYYVLTFRFETSRFDGDSTDTIYWLGKARLMMKDIAQGINSPLDIGAGVGAISTFLASFDTPAYYLGQEIVVKDDEIRDFLTLDRIQKINNSRFAFEISYARGPL